MKAHLRALGVVLALVVFFSTIFYFVRGPKSENADAKALTTLPEFSAVTIDGKSIRSLDYAGKLLIVNFWASWCGPCVEEVPSLINLANEMKGELRILALSNDQARSDIDVFLKSFPGLRNPAIDVVHDGGHGLAVTKMFSVFQLPESFVFDPRGRLVRKVVGSINWSSPEAITYLRDLLSKN